MSSQVSSRAQRLGVGDAVVMGLSSSGPSQTLAVSLAGLVAVCGYGGVVPILLCFVPMMGIAVAYQRLNRWDRSSGATYTWVARVFHPYLGFLSGWMILLYYTLGTTTLTIPAGIYTLDLIAPSLRDSHAAIFVVGSLWNVSITVLAVRGLTLVARCEWIIVIFEYAVLSLAAIVAARALWHGQTAAAFSWRWFSWDGIGQLKGLTGGILIAYFMYSGWDAAVYVNEETAGANSAGRAAVASVLMLAVLYMLTTLAFQSVLAPDVMQAHAGNVLSAVADRLLQAPWGAVMALVVLTGTLASLQSALVSATRMGVAMARDRVMPRYFVSVDGSAGSPWAATLTMSLLNVVLLGAALASGGIGTALANAASSLGLISLVFYGVTAAAAVWHQWAAGCRTLRDWCLGLLLPAIGVVFSVGVLIAALCTGAVSGVILSYGLGSIGVGAVVAAYLHRVRAVPFFSPHTLTGQAAEAALED